MKISIRDLDGNVIMETLSTWNNGIAPSANLDNANLQCADLSHQILKNVRFRGADLRGANLLKVDLSGADLRGANLEGANLQQAHLEGAQLEDADLCAANLNSARLDGANLNRANLIGANLNFAQARGVVFDLTSCVYMKAESALMSGSSFIDANLEESNFRRSNLSFANLTGARAKTTEFENAFLSKARMDPELIQRFSHVREGEFVAYKKVREGIMGIRVPADAQRSNATSNKCRAEYVIPIEMPKELAECTSLHDPYFKYRLGEVARCDHWEEDRWYDCAGGIHFYLTRREVEIRYYKSKVQNHAG